MHIIVLLSYDRNKNIPHQSSNHNKLDHTSNHNTSEIPLCTSLRTKYKSSYLKSYISTATHNPFQSSNCILYHIFHYMYYFNMSYLQCHYSLSLISYIKPNTFVEAIKFECWNQSMQVELNILENTRSWILVDFPPNVKLIRYRWIYKIKYLDNGPIKRLRLNW